MTENTDDRLRAVIRLRAMRPDDRAEYQAVLDTYMSALGL